MGKQSNKVEKKQRRLSYIKRKKAAPKKKAGAPGVPAVSQV
jgi:hypothetical protein